MIRFVEDIYADFLYDCYIVNQRLTEEDWSYYGKEEHHIEIPARDGGSLSPLNSQYLTTYQHWMAGVLQSEMLQKCCSAFVPKGVLPPWVESLRKKWASQQGMTNVSSGLLNRLRTPEHQSGAGKVSGRNNVTSGHLNRIRTPEHQSKAAKMARSKEPHEVKAARARSIPPEKAAIGRHIGQTKKFRCLVTGKVSTGGPLTKFQRARGIDTRLRVPV